MNCLPVLMLSIAATSDSFVIGFHFGVKGVRMGRVANLYISLVCFLGTAAAMLLGLRLGEIIPLWLAEGLGGALLLGLGLWMLFGAAHKKDNSLHGVCTDPASVDKDHSSRVELREAFGIGLVLAVNNMGLGIGGGVAGLPVLLTALLCAVGSYAFVGAGRRLGERISAGWPAKALETGSALLVIALGLSALF